VLPTNNIAFKEWAAICAALGTGLQTLIIRKGGIHEGREGFRVAHGEFWLLPTYVHEAAAGLEPEALPLLARAEADRPAAGMLRLAHYGVVTDVFEIQEERLLARLAGRHLWSARTVGERFHYRRPGLFVLTARIFARREAHVLPDSPHLAGCRSWVDLPVDLTTDQLQPVLTDVEFERHRQEIRESLLNDSSSARA
jgi:hypothetical protein